MDQEPRPEKKKEIFSTWEVVTKDNEGKAEKHTLHKYLYPIDPSMIPEIKAKEEKLSLRKKRIQVSAGKKACEDLFLFSDTHVGFRDIDGQLEPLHDTQAVKVAQEIAYDVQPDQIINLGDHLDNALLSHFPPDSDHFAGTLQASIDEGYNVSKGFREAAPKAKMVELEGNHTRLNRLLGKYACMLMGIKQANTNGVALFSYENMMNMEQLGIDYISGYPAVEYEYADDLHFRHGPDLRPNGSTAELLSKRYPYNGVVQGHGHKMQYHTRTLPNGHVLHYYMSPILGKTDGEIPSYHSAVDDHNKVVPEQEDWQQGVTVLKVYHGKLGNQYQFRPIAIEKGEAFYEGTHYQTKKK